MGNISSLIEKIEHRPFPLPNTQWVMQQSWSNLLFAHWPISADSLRSSVPAILKIDTYEGFAWLGIIPFAMRKVRPRYAFEIPPLSNFLELNVRTYVIKDGIPGVYFFSLDCSNPIAVWIARKIYHLPYFNANMKLSKIGSEVKYYSRRKNYDAVFEASYRPQGAIYKSVPGSIDQFLTERYCLYTTDKNGNCYRGVIHHDMWPLQSAEAEIQLNSMTNKQLGIDLPKTKPLLHYCESIDTIEWPLTLLK